MLRRRNTPDRPIKLDRNRLDENHLHIMAQLIGAYDRPIDPTLLYTPPSREVILGKVRFLKRYGIVELVDGDETKVKLTQAGGRFALDVLKPFQRTPEERARQHRVAQDRGFEPLAPGLPARSVEPPTEGTTSPTPHKPGGHLRSV